MRARPDVSKKRIELSVPQVAGSAVAAVVAAKLASYFGVYGTILGAGCRERDSHLRRLRLPALLQPDRRSAPGGDGHLQGGGTNPSSSREFTEGTVYRARVGSWKRPLLAAALVFGVTMTGITVYELVSGDSFSGGKGTTVSAAVTGHDTSSSPKSGDHEPSPADSPSDSSSGSSADPETSSGATDGGTESNSGGATPSPTPSASDGGGTPTPTPSASATDPAPSASSRSGTGDQDPADPAAP